MSLATELHNVPSYMYAYETFDGKFRADMWDRTLILTRSWTDGVREMLVNPNQYTPVLLTILLIAIVGLMLLYKGDTRTAPKGKKMQRDKELQILFSDAITDAVEDLRFKDKISRVEKRLIYKRLAKALELPDLVPIHPNKTKADIKHRLGNGVYKTKPNIPGDPPPVIEIVPKPVRKLGAIRSLVHKTA